MAYLKEGDWRDQTQTNVCIVEDEASGLKKDENRINTNVPLVGSTLDDQVSNNDPKTWKPETIKSEVIW